MYNGLFEAVGITKENLKDKSSDIAKDAGMDVAKYQSASTEEDARRWKVAIRGGRLRSVSTRRRRSFINGRWPSGARRPSRSSR